MASLSTPGSTSASVNSSRSSRVVRAVDGADQLVAEQDVVIVSLGAGQLLRGLGHVLRLQVVAPQEVRLARLKQRAFPLGWLRSRPTRTRWGASTSTTSRPNGPTPPHGRRAR
jgi:hypothetical protein